MKDKIQIRVRYEVSNSIRNGIKVIGDIYETSKYEMAVAILIVLMDSFEPGSSEDDIRRFLFSLINQLLDNEKKSFQ